MLGTTIEGHGATISINPSLWQTICNSETDVNKFTFRDCLSLLGKIPNTPDFLPPGIYPSKNLLQSLTARTKTQTNSTWDDPIPAHLFTLMSDFVNKCKAATIPNIPRLVDCELPVKIYCDASNDLSSYKIIQNGYVILSAQKPFTKSTMKLHINCKEMIAIFDALCRLTLFEQHCHKQFQSITVLTDSSTVYSILRNERTKASLMQPFQNKYLGYCQSLLGPRYRDIIWVLVKGDDNLADDLTRDHLVHKLICLRDKLPETLADELVQTNSRPNMGLIGLDQPPCSLLTQKRSAEEVVSNISKKQKMTTVDND
ncbi:hypothetical protein FOL47_000595 [Perkinsus chesapeaki]|uniref:Reverse transcriptase RNase H-like domain-containing protein n=1 Tax=Perkinsus chesapeaki TaxID=330153 RepID=A0A7J6KVH7_PERCH|nr:hypothetical protein FOL47_000595 [Perkinsus chesapeaki]